MKSGRRISNQSGFTLTEAMIATIILGLVLGSVLAIASQCLRYLTDIRRTARASQVLQQEMETIRLMNWTQMEQGQRRCRPDVSVAGGRHYQQPDRANPRRYQSLRT